jgi:hypothetical protein
MNRWIQRIRAWCLGAVLLGGSAALQAQPRDEWQQLLQVTSVEQVLREMPRYFEGGLQQAQAQGAQIPREVHDALKQAAQQVYSLEPLRDAASAQLRASLSPAQRDDWLAFYRTPLGQKVSQADLRATAPTFHGEVMARAPQIMEALGRDTSRMALLQSWLQATEAVEHATQMGLQMQMALEWGLMSTSPPAVGKPSFLELQAHFESQRFAMRAQVAQMLMASTALAYEGLSNAELSQLLQRANSPVGKALYVDFSRRLYQTLVVLAERIGQEAGRTLSRQPA